MKENLRPYTARLPAGDLALCLAFLVKQGILPRSFSQLIREIVRLMAKSTGEGSMSQEDAEIFLISYGLLPSLDTDSDLTVQLGTSDDDTTTIEDAVIEATKQIREEG